MGSGEPFRSSSCVLLLCGCMCYMSLPRGAAAFSVIVAFSCTSLVPWDQVSPSGPLVVFCSRVVVLYVSSSRCRCLVCDCEFSRASHAPWDQMSPSGPLVVICCRVAELYLSFSRCLGLVCDCDIFISLSCPLGSVERFRSSSCVLLSCGCVICLFLAMRWLGL